MTIRYGAILMPNKCLLFMLQNVFREVFDDDQLVIAKQSSPKDIDGWDSIAHVKLIIAVEEQFGIQISEDEIESAGTVGGFLEVIRKHHNQ
jgi:acyl carrier protein